MNVSKSKIVRSSRYLNVGRMDGRLNGTLLEVVDCCMHLQLQVAADGGCEWDVLLIMNEGIKRGVC